MIAALLLLAQAASAPARPEAPAPPYEPSGSVRLGNKALAGGDLARAAAEYEAALARDPSSSAALHNLGLVRLREAKFPDARAAFEHARAAGDAEVRFRAAYHIGHAFFRESEASHRDPAGLDAAIGAARAARDSFLDALEIHDDADARANAEIAARMLAALEKEKEEREKEPESQPFPESKPNEDSPESQPNESPDSQPSTDSKPSEGPTSRSSEGDPQSKPSESEPDSRPASRPEETPASQPEPESRPASRPTAGQEGAESRPVLPRERIEQLLDRLKELDEEREALEARRRRTMRVPVERDW